MEITKVVKDSYYYYGCPASEYKDMNYVEALRYKLKKATELKRKLAKKQYEVFEKNPTSGKYSEIGYRISEIEKAIIFNKELIKEAEGK